MSEENTTQAQPAEIRMTIEITRKETGKVEVYELIGIPEGEGEITVTEGEK